MVRPLLYDFKRTLRSKAVLVAMLLPIIISLAIIPLILGVGTTGFAPSNNVQAVMYYDSDGYRFLAYASDQYGLPVSGMGLQFNLTGSAQGNSYGASGVTNSSGYAFVTVKAPVNPNYNGLETIAQNGQGESYGFTPQGTSKNGSATQLSEGQVYVLPTPGSTFATVTDSTNASKRDLEIFYAGPYGTRPSYGLYYKVYNQSAGGGVVTLPNYYNESEMTQLGTLSDYHQIYQLNLPSNDSCSYQTTNGPGGSPSVSLNCPLMIYLELFAGNGTLVQYESVSLSAFLPPYTPPIQSVPIATAFFTQIMAIFIPLIAIIGAYSSYGKDRVTGVLESVLSRPVSRKGLSISRYLSTFLALALAIGIAVGVIDGILRYYGGTFLSAQVLLSATGAFVVELAAFMGLIFLFSHLVKSTGLLIGASIGLFIVLDFLWTVLTALVGIALRIDTGSLAYAQASTLANYFNPAQYVQLVVLYLTNNSANGLSIQASTLGVTIPSLVAAGLLWIALPFSAFLYLAVKRD